jgi:hypothetical protein
LILVYGETLSATGSDANGSLGSCGMCRHSGAECPHVLPTTEAAAGSQLIPEARISCDTCSDAKTERRRGVPDVGRREVEKLGGETANELTSEAADEEETLDSGAHAGALARLVCAAVAVPETGGSSRDGAALCTRRGVAGAKFPTCHLANSSPAFGFAARKPPATIRVVANLARNDNLRACTLYRR